MRKTNSLMLIIFLLTGLTLSAQNQTSSLPYLIKRAIEISPNIKMLQSKLSAARENIQIGTHLSDPVVNIGLVNVPVNTFSLNQEAMTAKVLGLTQAIPYPGSLKAKADVKAVDTSIIRQEIVELQNQIRDQVSELYFNLQEKRKEIKLSRESIDLLQQVSVVAKRKFEVGSASLQNIILVEVQLTRLKDKIESLSGEGQALQAQINAYLLRNDSILITTTKILPIKVQNLKTESLLKLAEQNRPLLKGIKLYENKARLQQKEAEYAFYPNFKIGFQYSQRSFNSVTGMNYPDFLGLVVGVTIPINYGGKKTAKVNQARYLQRLYKQQYNTSLQVLQQHFGKINSRLSALQNREKLVSKTLLPQTIQSYQAAMADYQVNKIDFVNVVKAEGAILKIKTELAIIRTAYNKNKAKLEFLSGTRSNLIIKYKTQTNE